MAKFSFNANIGKDMQAASADSFSDNIKMIDINEIAPSESNFYELSDIGLLADDIEREGLRHNLVVYEDADTGLYKVISGHRRLAAIKQLINENRLTSTKIPCYVEREKSNAETQFDLIMLNATQRKYTDADIMREYEEIDQTLKALEAEGKPLKGRMRERIAEILRVSPAQVGKIENIRHNAIEDVHTAVKNGEMSISTANEVAKLAPEKQQEIITEKPNISHKEVKEIQQEQKKIFPAEKEIEDENAEDYEEPDEDFVEDKPEDEPENDELSEDFPEDEDNERTYDITLSLSSVEVSVLSKVLDKALANNLYSSLSEHSVLLDVILKLRNI